MVDEGGLSDAEALQVQIDAIKNVIEQGEQRFLGMATAQKDLYDKGNAFSGGWSQGAVEAADYLRWIREQWIENY